MSKYFGEKMQIRIHLCVILLHWIHLPWTSGIKTHPHVCAGASNVGSYNKSANLISLVPGVVVGVEDAALTGGGQEFAGGGSHFSYRSLFMVRIDEESYFVALRILIIFCIHTYVIIPGSKSSIIVVILSVFFD